MRPPGAHTRASHFSYMSHHPSPALQPLPHWRRHDARVFAWMGAGHAVRPGWLRFAKWVSHWSWVPLTAVLAAWALQGWDALSVAFHAVLTGGAVQLLSKKTSARWQSARPFAVGLSPNHLDHSLRAGFPSTHATVMGCVCGFLWFLGAPAWVLGGVFTITLATGWARVYAGAHFPSDVIAGLALGTAIGAIVAWTTTL
jgi:undecaprenyl-diphosphatase